VQAPVEPGDGVPAPGSEPGGPGGAGGEPPIRQPRLGPVGWARWAWRQLTSMRTALLLLLLLAVAAVPGSVFPQRRIDPAAVDAYLEDNATAGPLLDRIGMFDVYTSPWFSAIYLLLFVSLIGCVLPRTRLHLRELRAPAPRTPTRLSRLPEHRTATVDGDPDAVLAAAEQVLRRRRYRVAVHDGGRSVAGQRGYLAETGNLVFHLALVGLLLAVAAGSLFGYSGQVLVLERTTFANALPNYDSFQAGPRVDTDRLSPFSFRLDHLAVAFEEAVEGRQRGAPRVFDATVTATDRNGAAPRTTVVRPNEPLDVGGVRGFLVGNGYAPEITVRDAQGRIAARGPVPFLPRDGAYTSLGVLKVPDAAPRQLALQGFFLPTGAILPGGGPVSIFPDARRPLLVLTAYVTEPGKRDLRLDDGVYVLDQRNLEQLRGPDGDLLRLLLRPGQRSELPGGVGSVTFDGWRRYGVFDVRSDPTKGWALAASVLALAGVTTSLFVRRRRVWVRVAADGQMHGPGQARTVVEVGGLARGQDGGLGDEVESVLAALTTDGTSTTDGTGPTGTRPTGTTTTKE